MKNTIRISGAILLIIAIFLNHSCKKDKPSPPVLTTTAVTEISVTTATSGGNIITDGGATITASGVCWNTGVEPIISDSKTTDAAVNGSFKSNLTGLEGGAIYYVRAYASNIAGTGYGTAMSFTTLGQAPTATTEAAANITTTSVTLHSSVNANYLSTAVTFEYGTTTNYGSTINATQSPITGSTNTPVSSDLIGLTPGTTYHFRIKTVNTRGTIYGSDLTFTTLGAVPTATTQAASNITITTSTLNGTINANDLSTTVTFDYGTTTDYESNITASQSPLTGHINTAVTANLSGLNPGTLYHFRIKAVNSLGTTYGSDLTFITLGAVPTATTQAATNINMTSAEINGTVNVNYLSTSVTFEYGLTSSYDNSIIVSQSPMTGNITTSINASLIGLAVGTTYHYRIKAINSLGTTFGNDIIFTTLAPITDIDGNIYGIVTIGTQVWMAKNLAYLPSVSSSSSGSEVAPYYYVSGYEGTSLSEAKATANYTTFGVLYNWEAAKTSCPLGWHVPTDAEWTTLTTFLGGEAVAGGKLKETGTTHWTTPNTGATNETGFTALPGGYRHENGYFTVLGESAPFWSATQWSTEFAYWRYLHYTNAVLQIMYNSKSYGFSVRCLRDF